MAADRTANSNPEEQLQHARAEMSQRLRAG
jgi:hypothetical protein